MSGFVKIGLRLVGTTRYIPNKNTTKYLQSMCHVRNGSSHVIKNSITSAQKESTGYWKKISAVAKKTLMYSTIPLTVIVVGCTYLVKRNLRFWEDINMIAAVHRETLKYSIIPSTIITSSVLFNDGEIQIKTRENNIHLINDNTRILMGSEELNANMLDPFPRGEPIPMKIGKFNGLLNKGKLILQTEDGDTTFIIHHTLGLEVKKSSETLQNEIAANKKIGKFSYSFPGSEMTYAARTTEEKWTVPYHTPSDPDFGELDYNSPYVDEIVPMYGNSSFSCDTRVKLQKDESDEIYCFTQIVHFECDKKLDENTLNEIATEIKFCDELTEEMKTCDVIIDSGIIVFKTHDGDKLAVRQIVTCEVLEDGPLIYLHWTQKLVKFDSW